MSNSLHLNFQMVNGDADKEIGAVKADTQMIYVGTGCDGAITLKAAHPQDETDILPIDGAVFSTPGVYSLANIPRGTSIWASYAGSTTCSVTIR